MTFPGPFPVPAALPFPFIEDHGSAEHVGITPMTMTPACDGCDGTGEVQTEGQVHLWIKTPCVWCKGTGRLED